MRERLKASDVNHRRYEQICQHAVKNGKEIRVIIFRCFMPAFCRYIGHMCVIMPTMKCFHRDKMKRRT